MRARVGESSGLISGEAKRFEIVEILGMVGQVWPMVASSLAEILRK